MVHSRLSQGEKIERFQKAERGELRVMIGPRSALFTPFKNLGLIVIDEFHENSYLSDQTPRYSTVETAIERASFNGAKVVLGSATPSVEIYDGAVQGKYGLFRLSQRAVPGSVLPEVEVGDYIAIHDTGAHGYAMGYNYNGKLKSAELLLKEDGSIQMIRRAETPKDYFATLDGFDIYDKIDFDA